MQHTIEESLIRPADIGVLNSLKNRTIEALCFNVNGSINKNASSTIIQAQSVVLIGKNEELIITNHYTARSRYGTSLKYLLLRKTNKSNRPYPFNYYETILNSPVKDVEVRGEKSQLNATHKVHTQHIIRLVLTNDISISILSESFNKIIIRIEPSSEAVEYLNNFHIWEI